LVEDEASHFCRVPGIAPSFGGEDNITSRKGGVSCLTRIIRRWPRSSFTYGSEALIRKRRID